MVYIPPGLVILSFCFLPLFHPQMNAGTDQGLNQLADQSIAFLSEQEKKATSESKNEQLGSNNPEVNSKISPMKRTEPEKKFFKWQGDGSTFDISFYLFPEFFYGKNLTLLNNKNPDELIIFRHFIDSFATYTYGNATREFFKAKCGVRSRSVWGNNISVLETTDTPIRELGAVFGPHRHGIVLNELWIRELWFEMSLNDLLGLPFCARHVLTCGAFFFEIGRGISLGANYPSLPAALGFFIDAQIDQYAFGAKLSGELEKDRLSYDIYGAFFNNRSATFEQTNARIRAHEFGHRLDGARGFGIINYVVAARLQWYPIKINDQKDDQKKVYFEPYAVYNHNPELRLDLFSDGVSDLATFGLMAECAFGPIECGFEGAFNRGQLHAFGIDRNTIVLADDDGKLIVTHDQVSDIKTGSDALVADAQQQAAIVRSPQTQRSNNKMIALANEETAIGDHIPRNSLQNKKWRYREPFDVHYRGYFFVADASYIFCKDVLKASLAIGIASGGEDPRKALALGKESRSTIDYDGFITLDSSYAGKRVSSMLFFNGFGTFPRVIDIGLEGLMPDATVLNITGFTNLIYMGASVDYNYKNSFHKWRVSPNLLFFWQEEPARKFESIKHPRNSALLLHRPQIMDHFLGTEVNILAEIEAVKDFTFFVLAGLFVPGFHFREMRGMPFNATQARFINDKKGPRESLLGDDSAYFFDVGFKYTF